MLRIYMIYIIMKNVTLNDLRVISFKQTIFIEEKTMGGGRQFFFFVLFHPLLY